MTKYITDKKLVDKKNVKIDANLEPFWEESKEPENEVDENGKKKEKKTDKVILKERLFARIEEFGNPYYRLVDLKTGESDTKAGKFKGLNILAEKAHNKNVTRVVGME